MIEKIKKTFETFLFFIKLLIILFQPGEQGQSKPTPETQKIIVQQKEESGWKSALDKMHVAVSDKKALESTMRKYVNGVGVKTQEMAQNAGRAVYHQSKIALWVFIARFPMFVGFAIVFVLYASDIMSYSYNFFIDIFTMFSQVLVLNLIAIGWLATMSSVMLVFSIFLILFPAFTNEQKMVAYRFELWILLMTFAGLFIWSFLFNDALTFEENINEAKINTQSSLGEMWETFTCNIDPACIQAKIEENQAKNAPIFRFKHEFLRPPTVIYTDSELEDLVIDLTYSIGSSDYININQISCHYKSPLDEPLYVDTDFGNQNPSIRTGDSEITFNTECTNFDQIPLSKTQKIEDYRIISLMNLNLTTIFTQEIPAVEYEYIRLEQENPRRDYTFNFLKEQLDEKTRGDKELIRSNDALSMDTSTVTNSLPLLIGDPNEPREFLFPISISKNKRSNYGELVEAKIVEIILPPVLEYVEEPDFIGEALQFDDEKFYKTIKVREVEGIEINEIALFDLIIVIDSQFVKEDMFSIKIDNENFVEQSTIDDNTYYGQVDEDLDLRTLSTSEIISVLEELKDNFENLRDEYNNRGLDTTQIEDAINELDNTIYNVESIRDNNNIDATDKDSLSATAASNYNSLASLYNNLTDDIELDTNNINSNTNSNSRFPPIPDYTGTYYDGVDDIDEAMDKTRTLVQAYDRLIDRYDDEGEDSTFVEQARDNTIELVDDMDRIYSRYGQGASTDEEYIQETNSAIQRGLNLVDDYEMYRDYLN